MVKRPAKVCVECGRRFTPKRARFSTYCGLECSRRNFGRFWMPNSPNLTERELAAKRRAIAAKRGVA